MGGTCKTPENGSTSQDFININFLGHKIIVNKQVSGHKFTTGSLCAWHAYSYGADFTVQIVCTARAVSHGNPKFSRLSVLFKLIVIFQHQHVTAHI